MRSHAQLYSARPPIVNPAAGGPNPRTPCAFAGVRSRSAVTSPSLGGSKQGRD